MTDTPDDKDDVKTSDIDTDTDTDTDTAEAADVESTAVAEPESGAIEESVTDEPDTGTEDTTEVEDEGETAGEPEPKSGVAWTKVFAFGVLPVILVLLVAAVAVLGYLNVDSKRLASAQADAVRAASDSTVTLLSYRPDSVRQQLTDARDLLTGSFKDDYTSLTDSMIIPEAEKQRVSAVATVPRVAPVSTELEHAVVLVFVNQTVVIGDNQPSATLSSVRVTLDKVDGRWLISKFDPV